MRETGRAVPLLDSVAEVETLAAVIIGALIAFGGVVYTESRRDKREQKARESEQRRTALR